MPDQRGKAVAVRRFGPPSSLPRCDVLPGTDAVNVALGLLAVVALTAATGYFVAQEFTFVTADRLALQRQAAEGDKKAARAVKVMGRLSFMLSGAQLGITVTTLVVGFIAKPALAEVIAP